MPFTDIWIPAGEQYGDSAAQYWANKQVETGNYLYAIPGALASLWTPETSGSTAATLSCAAAGSSAVRSGYDIWFRRYPKAGGGGIGLDRYGKNIIRADWHRWGKNGNIKNRPHIDIPGKTKHWPWKK